MGSIRDARRAGKYPAINATAVSAITIPTNVTGSDDVTSNRKLRSARANAQDAPAPIAIPMAANASVCKMIRICKSPADAPNAMRIPISCVR